MRTDIVTGAGTQKTTFAELFTPKLFTVLKEGYSAHHFRADVLAGLTVAIVALPLSMAIAIASGVSPSQGIYTAIIGGFVVSALGGSRFQIGGPAGAFIVLVAGTVQAHGVEGLILATIMSGMVMVVAGYLRLGTYIKFIPYPVTIGFTAGIAVIIFASQIKDLLGLSLEAPEPGPLIEKLEMLWQYLPHWDSTATAIAFGSITIIAILKAVRPNWPNMLVAILVMSVISVTMGLQVETIGTRFGGIAAGLPWPSLPSITGDKVLAVLPNALSFALLGSIESLLSAVVADGMSGRRHRSNCELVGQGFANIASGLFGGFCVTGTIARTATNVRSGAHGPIAGMLHSLFLLVFLLVAAPLASYIPLACLAGVLTMVAWNMMERHAMFTLLRASRGEAAVLAVTFGLTIFRDLTEAIVVGFALGAVLFIHRMSVTTAVDTDAPYVAEDLPDSADGARTPYDEDTENRPQVLVFRITGAFFFGAAATIGPVLDRMSDQHKLMVIDFSAVPFLDSTAANIIEGMAKKSLKRGITLALSGTSHEVRQDLFANGVKPPLVSYANTIEQAIHKYGQELDKA